MLSWASAAFRSLNNLITLSSRVFSFLGNKITGETLILFFAWNQPNSTRLALWVTYFNPHRSPRQIKNILKQIKILPRCSLHTVLPGSLIAVGGWQQSVNSRWSRPDRNRNIWFTGGVKIPGLNGTREWRGEKVGTPPLRRPQRSHNKRETKTSWMFLSVQTGCPEFRSVPRIQVALKTVSGLLEQEFLWWEMRVWRIISTFRHFNTVCDAE